MSSSSRRLVELSREEVLELTSTEKLRYFKDVVVRHPRMEEAVDDVITLSAPNTGTDIILMIGPTGAGKSASIETVQRKVLETCHSELCADPGFIPIVSAEVKLTHPRRSNFDPPGRGWRLFLSRRDVDPGASGGDQGFRTTRALDSADHARDRVVA